jgi:hypothetical protein
MIDLADPRPARIFTTWGTVLYVDSASGQLRHGPIETSPEIPSLSPNGLEPDPIDRGVSC